MGRNLFQSLRRSGAQFHRRREFSAGQNIYVLFDAADFMTSILAFLREDGRRKFLTNVGEALDSQGLELADRRDWSKLLSSV